MKCQFRFLAYVKDIFVVSSGYCNLKKPDILKVIFEYIDIVIKSVQKRKNMCLCKSKFK